MVKIRLRRIGTKARPFYRVVVTPSTSARNGRFVENLGTYDPVRKPIHIQINEDRALHWLLSGAQPTETTARLLNKVGILDKFFEQRPKAKENYAFLDKRTAAMSVQSVIAEPAKKESAPAPEPEAPEVEAAAPAPAAEAVVETPPAPEAVAEEAPSEAVAEEPEAGVEAPVAIDEAAPESAEEPAEAEKSE